MRSGIERAEDGTWLFWSSNGITVEFGTRLKALKVWHDYLEGEPEFQRMVQDLIVEEESLGTQELQANKQKGELQ